VLNVATVFHHSVILCRELSQGSVWSLVMVRCTSDWSEMRGKLEDQF